MNLKHSRFMKSKMFELRYVFQLSTSNYNVSELGPSDISDIRRCKSQNLFTLSICLDILTFQTRSLARFGT